MAKKEAGLFSAELLDQLLSGRDSKSVLDPDGLIGDSRMLARASAGNNSHEASGNRVT
ncbi:MAG: hypothetical protein ACT4P0_08590 [Panacagrimonas sp.]